MHEIPQFLVHISRFERILLQKTFIKLRTAGKRFVQLRSFIRIPKKHFYRLENLSENHGQKSWDALLCFFGVFHCTQVQPLPSPHKQCWTRVSRIFFKVSTLFRVGGGRTARKCRKGCTVFRGNREMTEKYEYCSTVPFQGLLSRIVVNGSFPPLQPSCKC